MRHPGPSPPCHWNQHPPHQTLSYQKCRLRHHIEHQSLVRSGQRVTPPLASSPRLKHKRASTYPNLPVLHKQSQWTRQSNTGTVTSHIPCLDKQRWRHPPSGLARVMKPKTPTLPHYVRRRNIIALIPPTKDVEQTRQNTGPPQLPPTPAYATTPPSKLHQGPEGAQSY